MSLFDIVNLPINLEDREINRICELDEPNYTELKTEYEELKTKYDVLNTKYEELVETKKQNDTTLLELIKSQYKLLKLNNIILAD